jgi:hypothetical protein
MRAGIYSLWLGVSILLVALVPLVAAAATAREYQVKAVFLFNFTQFVTWPSGPCTNAASPLIIGVLGDDPYGSYLDETVRGEKIGGRPLVVQRYRSVAEVPGCQILFIGISEDRRLQEAIALLKDRSVLTVTDGAAGRSGGIVRFVTENNRVRLQIDVGAAKAAGLTISSKLLRAAQIIGVDGD